VEGLRAPVTTSKMLVMHETGDMGAAQTNSGEDAAPIHQSDCPYQHGAREIHIGVRKASRNAWRSKIDQEADPVKCRVKLKEPKRSERVEGLQSLHGGT